MEDNARTWANVLEDTLIDDRQQHEAINRQLDIERAVDSLPLRQAVIIKMTTGMEFTYMGAAKVLGIAKRTVIRDVQAAHKELKGKADERRFVFARNISGS